MKQTREFESNCADLNGLRNKLLGIALLAFVVVALGAYSFASGDAPPDKQAAVQTASTREIRTTPDNPAQQQMPPPVAPSRTE